MRKVAITLTTTALLLLMMIPAFGAGINGQQEYAVAIRSPVTFLNFSNGYNQFPVGDILSGFKVHPDGIALDLYSAGYEEDYDPEYLNTVVLPIANTSDPADLTPVQVYPSNVATGWNPIIWDGRYYQLSGADGRLTLSYYPEGYTHPNSYTGNVIYYKCFTDSNFVTEQYTINSYSLNYNAPVYQSDGTIQISPDYSPNGNDALYFEAMKNAGWYDLQLLCQSAGGESFTVHVQWLAYAGDYRYNMGGYLTQSVSPDINTGASYEYGYSQGVTAGKNSMQSAVNEAYENGFSAGVNASDSSGGVISSAIFALGDVPFNILFDIVDMDILGVNLASLVSMAITGAVLIFIIKMFLI